MTQSIVDSIDFWGAKWACSLYRDTKPSNKEIVNIDYLERLKELQSNKKVILLRADKRTGLGIPDKKDLLEKRSHY